MKGEKVLVVGCTGQVALPVAKALAKENGVWGIARFTNASARDELEAAGVTCHAVDVAEPDLSGLPDDFGYVLNFSVARTGSWDGDLDTNVGAVLHLMEHCRATKAFLHCSTTGVYQAQRDHVFKEDDALGDNHRPWEPTMPFLATYSISKIASEAAARYASRRWNVPTVITRLGVPYGDNGGWPAFHLEMLAAGMAIPVHPDRPNRFNPIHEDDIISTVPALLAAATVPPTVINWAGAESSIEEWCAQLGELIGLDPKFEETDDTIASVPVDTARLDALAGGERRVSLSEGLRRMVAARRPELLKQS
jgi:nucleoside-diphosphate-sugar epimerase